MVSPSVTSALVAEVPGQAGAVGLEESVPAGQLGAEDVDRRGVAGEVRDREIGIVRIEAGLGVGSPV
jgi:hypothetical protein